jgi:hypothetical protein
MILPENYQRAIDEVADRYRSGLSDGINEIVWNAKINLSGLKWELNRSEINWLPREQVDMLRDMTDGVLEQAGFDLSDGQPAQVVIFTAKMKPRAKYDLKIYSVADNVAGFNTSRTGPGQNNSRRWVIYADRGERFGGAYDYKGAVYARTGLQEKPHLMENIPTPLDRIIPHVFSNHIGPIKFELAPELGQKVA